MSSIFLACPLCKISLQQEADGLICPVCERIYPQTLGIPRLCDPSVLPVRDETARVEKLCKMYDGSSFEELALARFDARPVNDKRWQRFTEYGLATRERGQRFYQMFRSMSAQFWTVHDAGFALDVGCGTGAGLVAMAQHFDHVIGVDVSLAALIVAKKLVESEGLRNITLVQGVAQSLPFLNGVFNFVIAINVLEHVLVPKAMLTEVHRVLATNGVFCGDSRNRFDLVFPEPHVGLRWVGFLPRKWMAPYVRWRINASYDHIHLLSYADLRRMLKVAFGCEWRVVIPDVSAYGVSTTVKRVLNRVNEIRPIRPVLVHLSPVHLVLARRA